MIYKFDFILFDLVGTTVNDSGSGDSLIANNFSKAFALNGLQINFQEISSQRGRSKKEAIANILNEHNSKHELIDKIYGDFMGLLASSIEGFTEINGALTLFELLKEKGIKIGLGSGLPLEFVVKIVEKVGWRKDTFDYIESSDVLGKGRPDPIMILDAIQRFRIKEKDRVLKVGDTIVDIQEGKNAGVMTAGVLTGTQTKEELEIYKPDYILTDITAITSIL